jgi:hypothetical protein
MEKKRFVFATVFAVLVVFFVVGMAGCESPSSGSGVPALTVPSQGTLTVYFGLQSMGSQSVMRTVLPADDEFSYKVGFEATQDGASVAPIDVTGNSITAELVVGTYTVTVTAYSGSTVVATGEQTGVGVAAGTQTEPVTITMKPKTGGDDGTFSYVITFPVDVSSAQMVIDPQAEGENTPINLLEKEDGTGTESLAPGYYDVTVLLEMGEDSTGDTETIHIYSGMTSLWERDFTDDYFNGEEASLEVVIVNGEQEIPLDTATESITLQKGGDTLVLNVDENAGFSDVTWSVDGVKTDVTGFSFTLDADSYNVSLHTLTVKAVKNEKPYSRSIKFSVTAAASGPDEPIASGPVTADGLAACLATLPVGTVDAPSTVVFDASLNVSSDAWGTTVKDAFTGLEKYVVLDLSACSADNNTIVGFSNTAGNHFNIIKTDYIIGVILPKSLTSIGDEAFSQWTNLKQVEIGTLVTSIGNSVFTNNSNLTEIIIPNGVLTIGVAVFYNCTSLTSVTIPAAVTSIGNSTFKGCTFLTTIVFEGSPMIAKATVDNGFKDFYDIQSTKAGTYVYSGSAWSKQ